MHKKLKYILIVLFIFGYKSDLIAQSKIAEKFDTLSLQFKGNKEEQAKYLLRFVKKYAHLGDNLTDLPIFLNLIVNDKIPIIRPKKLQTYLDKENISQLEIGGMITAPICNADGIKASYFVIHDTSNFLNDSTSFPKNIDSASWNGNRLDNKLTFKNTHLFINRMGLSITSNDMSEPIRGTKFENPAKNPLIQKNILGTFIHIEVIQPRIADIGKKNDAIAINPGFTTPQYKRLALLYIVASTRKGAWLMPTFHAVLDEGIPDGHDDPQNFELDKFDQQISDLIKEINI